MMEAIQTVFGVQKAKSPRNEFPMLRNLEYRGRRATNIVYAEETERFQ